MHLESRIILCTVVVDAPLQFIQKLQTRPPPPIGFICHLPNLLNHTQTLNDFAKVIC